MYNISQYFPFFLTASLNSPAFYFLPFALCTHNVSLVFLPDFNLVRFPCAHIEVHGLFNSLLRFSLKGFLVSLLLLWALLFALLTVYWSKIVINSLSFFLPLPITLYTCFFLGTLLKRIPFNCSHYGYLRLKGHALPPAKKSSRMSQLILYCTVSLSNTQSQSSLS